MYASPRERTASALAAFVVVLLIVYALVFGLKVDVVAHAPGALVSIFLDTPKPPEHKEPKRRIVKAKSPAPKGAPSPRNLKNKATPVVAPPPKLPPLIVPPPIVVATQAGTGRAVSNGASDRPGPGQGAGGFGNGNGGGGTGGNGEGDGESTRPVQIKGHLSFSDLPDGVLHDGQEARVGISYVVDVDGRVIDCRTDEPSGIAELDALTCRLVQKRFRFRPALDRAGRPMQATIVESHTWVLETDPRDRRGG